MKKILVSLGLILTLVLCCAFVPVNAAEECNHEELTFQFFLESQEKPENCLESGIAKYVCDDCGASVYLKETGPHTIVYEFTELTCLDDQLVVEKCTLCKQTIDTHVVTEAKGEHEFELKAVAAKCGRAAGKAEICKNCGTEKKDSYVANDGAVAPEHQWEDTKTVVATCQTDGYTLQTCKNCKETRKIDVVTKGPAHHVKELVSVLKKPGCETTGIGKYKCTLCDADEWYESMAIEHTWDFDNMVVIKKVTCGQDGLAKVKCKLCDAKNDAFVLENDEYEHQWEEVILEEDCTNPARVGKICAACGAEDLKPVAGSKPLEHKYNEVVCEPDCERGAGSLKTCTVCGHEEYVEYTQEGLASPALGHDEKPIEAVASTCTKKGYSAGTYCARCEKILVEPEENEELDKNNHANKELVLTLKAATCTTLGVGKFECADCKKDLGYESIGYTHAWKLVRTDKKATCSTEGQADYKCTICNATDNDRKVEKLPHKFVEKHINKCGEAEKIVDVCSVCKAEGEVKFEGDIVKHTWGEVKTYPATCEVESFLGKVCLNPQCGAVVKYETVAPALGHDFVETFYEATCEKANGVFKVCQRCDKEVDREFTAADGEVYRGALGHLNDKVLKGYAATCTTKGLSNGVQCSACGKITTKQTAINVNTTSGHKIEVVVELKANTCTENGIGKFGCVLCGKVEEYYGVIEAEHDYEEIITKAPTCGKSGKAYKICKVEDCRHKTSEYTVAATGEHNYEEGVKPATCTTPDQYGLICTVCNTPKEALQPVAGSKALGHAYVEKYFAETCTLANGVVKSCSRCNASSVKTTTYFKPEDGDMYRAPLGHDVQPMDDVAATCSKKGSTGGEKCTRCSYVKTPATVIDKDATNHNFSKLLVTLKTPDCENTGIGKYQCSWCKAVESYKVMPEKHETIDVIVKHATCGEPGEKYELCTLCGDESDIIVIPATEEHIMVSDYVIEATCTSAAIAGKICAVCEYYDEDDVVPVGTPTNHAYKETPCEATCGRAAGVLKVCEDCKHEEFVEYAEGSGLAAPAKEHNYVEVTVESTCKVVGYTAEVCENCGDIKEETQEFEDGVNPNKHNPVQAQIIKAPTCENAGVAKAKCADCGKDAGYISVPAKCKFGTPEADASGMLVYVECSVCKKIEVVSYFGPEEAGIKAGDQFESLEAFEDAIADFIE